jgi:hypothetical protein
MTLKTMLTAMVSAITEEAERNKHFKASLERALGLHTSTATPRIPTEGETQKKGGRRTPAVLDPVEFARQGEEALRAEMKRLSLDQLRDIVAQYGMDPGKLVMKWKDSDRVVERIVELALARATKGDAFRND